MSSTAVEYWSRRTSTETILSIQGKETDYVHDSTDSESVTVEYEPATDSDQEPPAVGGYSSSPSDDEIISTRVIEVSVLDEGDLELADSEQTESGASDSEIDLHDYWRCAQCCAANNNPLYRYCERCFKVRKNFFPPRPKRKKRASTLAAVPRTLSQDSGIESQDLSQGKRQGNDVLTRGNDTFTQGNDILSQGTDIDTLSQETLNSQDTVNCSQDNDLKTQIADFNNKVSEKLRHVAAKRRADNPDRDTKRIRLDSGSDSVSDNERNKTASEPEQNIETLVKKTVSDPSLTVEEVKLTKKVISDTLKEKVDDFCIVCLSQPKSGVFVHGRIAHICCCYKCAVKVWVTAKRCPVCNCKVSNVLKAVVM